MTHKKIGATLLVAGTCIGSGMIALPMVLAKLGLVPSIMIMVLIWGIMYFTSLINLELNLQAGEGLPLGMLGRRFSGKTAEYLGTVCLKLLSYALLAVFIYGGSSIILELVETHTAFKPNFTGIASVYALMSALLFLLPIKIIDHINRALFVTLIGIVALLVIGLTLSAPWSQLPLFSSQTYDWRVWAAIIPVVFTSFGFQVIFHTLTNYCKKEPQVLKQAFFFGSLIPAIVYILWTCTVLGTVYRFNPTFYEQMVTENVEVGDLVRVLSEISEWTSMQLLVWWISILAITTSVLGVGIGLFDSLYGMVGKKGLASLLTILPAYLIAIFVPNAFIAALGFAGMILAIIAILLPVYLAGKLSIQFYPELKHRTLIYLSVGVGIAVIASELYILML